MFEITLYARVVRAVVSLQHAATCKHHLRGGERRRRIASTINHKHRRTYILAVVIIALGLLIIAGVAAANW